MFLAESQVDRAPQPRKDTGPVHVEHIEKILLLLERDKRADGAFRVAAAVVLKRPDGRVARAKSFLRLHRLLVKPLHFFIAHVWILPSLLVLGHLYVEQFLRFLPLERQRE